MHRRNRVPGGSLFLAMTPRQALTFVCQHGVVLESAQGPVPSLAEAIAGERIHGSWWAHPSSHLIFELTRFVRDNEQVLVCRAVQGKVTLVHRRLWPALVRLSSRFPTTSLARISEVHTASGRHVARSLSFPQWVPARVGSLASRLSEADAQRALGAWVSEPARRLSPRSSRRRPRSRTDDVNRRAPARAAERRR